MKNIEQALAYLQNGFSVIPIKKGTKEPFVLWKEYQTRKPTEEKITNWWTQYPDAGIAIVTGKISNLVIVDTEKGADILTLELPTTVTVQSGGGGKHFYYRYPINGLPTIPRIKELIDIKADGGYVIAPPSIHPSGNQYSWLSSPENTAIAQLPDWVLQGRKNKNQSHDWKEILGGASQGNRNTNATILIGKLLGSLRTDDWQTIALPLVEAWNAKNNPPLPFNELQTTFNSIAKSESVRRQEDVLHSYSDDPAMQRKQPRKNTVLQVSDENVQSWVDAELIENLTSDTGSDGIEWIWEGYIAKGLKTLISAYWKAGKTTLLIELIKSILTNRPVAGMATTNTKIYIVSEESKIHWLNRREKHKLAGFIVRSKPFPRKLSRIEWELYLQKLSKNCKIAGYELVVFDTISDFWCVSDENDAIEVKDALRPMNYLTEAGIAVLIFHHFNRNGTREGGAGRGSGALPADVDVSIDFNRYAPDDDNDTRRVLKGGNSRFEETPREVVIELTNEGYVAHGTKAEIIKDENLGKVLALLPIEPNTTIVSKIISNWEDNSKPDKSTVSRALNELERIEKAKRRKGAGNKPDLWSRVADNPENDATQSRNEADSVALQDEPYIGATQQVSQVLKSCYACNGAKFWKTMDGAINCATCHPPVSEADVKERIEA